MSSELIILASARKRGYGDDDLLHVVAHPVRRIRQDDGMVMYVGPDTAGRIMEVGLIVLTDGEWAIAHAMRPARTNYLPTKGTTRRR